jgi:hypothetical protein
MKYNINVIKFVWRQLRKPSRVTLDAATLPARSSLWNIGATSGACDYVAKFTKDASNADLGFRCVAAHSTAGSRPPRLAYDGQVSEISDDRTGFTLQVKMNRTTWTSDLLPITLDEGELLAHPAALIKGNEKRHCSARSATGAQR